jgi:hypothetical protein
MSQTIQLRRGTALEWTLANPILAPGEMGVETDTFAYKIGNGTIAWNNLPYKELTGIFSGALVLEAINNPSVPNPGALKFYAHDIAGRLVPKWVGPSGLDNPIQSALYSNGIIFSGPGLGTSLSVLGFTVPTASGTISHPAPVTGVNLKSATRRAIVTSAATVNSTSSLRFASPLTYRGEVFGSIASGGFFCSTRFAVSSTTALQRCNVGLLNATTAIAGTQVISALTNCIMAGWDSTDTNLQIMHNDAAGTCTKIDLGANFPANNTSAVYEVIFFAAPNSDTVGYRVKRLDVDFTATGILSVDLPTKTTLLTWHANINNGGTAAAVVLDFMRVYLETDF